MYALFLFGMSLEEKWGWKRFLAYYLVTGTGAGVATFLWNLGQGSFVPTVGASGAIFGVLLAFGIEFPDVVLLMFFVIPMRARLAVVVFGGLELVFLLTGIMRGIGHFTHLAGLLFGYLYYLIGIRERPGGARGGRRKTLRAFGTSAVRRDHADKRGERGGGKRGVSADIARAVALKKKIGSALPLSRADTAFIMKLNKAFNSQRGGICEPAEFDLAADSCRSCEDVYACLYRFLIGGDPSR
jgi:hypothetical protein